MSGRANLTVEQRELLDLLVETTSLFSEGDQRSITLSSTATGVYIYHRRLPREKNELAVQLSNVRHLEDLGLIRVERLRGSESGRIIVTQSGLEEANLQKRGADVKDNPRRVWVVHGRNLRARTAMFEFLRALNLEPIEWPVAVADTGSAAPYVGEVLEKAFEGAQAVVVLLTGDDLARLRQKYIDDTTEVFEAQLQPQPRPNVLFEAGMALATHPNATLLVSIGRLRPFSNVLGRHLINMHDGIAARQEVAKRLETAGCPVNRDGTDWHSAGDFTGAMDEDPTDYGGDASSPDSIELDEEQLKILELFIGGEAMTDVGVAQRLNIKQMRAKYRLEQLEDLGVIRGQYSINRPPQYVLSNEGRAHLFSLGKI